MPTIGIPHSLTSRRGKEVSLHLVVGVIFVLTAFVRFMAVAGFPNDHFVYITPAQQMMWGALPSRDFVDPGTPLMYAATALLQLAVGAPLLAEAVLMATMFGLAAALTVYGAYRASGALTIAVMVTAMEVALFPRTYHYPKLVLYAAGVLAMWWYIDRPNFRRAALLGACVVVAFLFRHDHGLFLGLAGTVAVAGARRGWADAARRTLSFAGVTILFVVPYLAFLAATTGVGAHVAAGLAYSRAEADRTRLPLQTFRIDEIASADNLLVWLFYVFHALPVIALAMVFATLRRNGTEAARLEAARVVALAVLAMAANVAMLRDSLTGRLPDVAAPACLLAAWLIPRAWRSPGLWRVPVRILQVIVLAVSLAAVTVVGTPREQIDRADLLTPPGRWPGYFWSHVEDFRNARNSGQLPTPTVRGLLPVLEYLDRCTAPGDPLFIAGDAPEVYVAARRRFAGGQPLLRTGYFSSAEDQQRLIVRLRSERVPVALLFENTDATTAFPLVMRELEAAFQSVTQIRIREDIVVDVLVHREMTATGIDPQMRLPCFR